MNEAVAYQDDTSDTAWGPFGKRKCNSIKKGDVAVTKTDRVKKTNKV